MTVWLTSYPRSGNTLTRLILHSVFGLRSSTIYEGELEVFNEFAPMSDLVGHAPLPAEVGEEGELSVVKTHGPPTDSSPAIYVVRDGRSSIVSWYHYLHAYTDNRPTLEAVIRGEVWPGRWCDHVEAWHPWSRKNTLMLRYEELSSNSELCVQRIGQFLGLEAGGQFDIRFEDLQKANPKFFRKGNNDSALTEIEPFSDLFNQIHGETMMRLGYYGVKY